MEKQTIDEEVKNYPEKIDQDEEGAFYITEEIVDKRMVKGKPQYLVKWEGWPSEFNSWEPLKNLENIMEMVYEFEAELREKRKSQPMSSNSKAIQKDKIEDELTQLRNSLQKKQQKMSEYQRNFLEAQKEINEKIKLLKQQLESIDSEQQQDNTE